MKRTFIPVLAASLLAGLAGCQSNAPSGAPAAAATQQAAPQAQSSQDEIRTAIQAHLAHNSNLNVQSFDTVVKQVTINGDHAEAQVEFRVKGGPGAMELTYQLQRQGGAWAVVESAPQGGDFSHPPLNQAAGAAGAPAPAGNPNSLADTLRSFQQGGFGGPTSPASAPTLPPGHPQINSNAGSAAQ